MSELPNMQAHFVVVFDTKTNSWFIEPDDGYTFPNGEVYFPTLQEWRCVDSDDPILEHKYGTLRETILDKLNDKVGA